MSPELGIQIQQNSASPRDPLSCLRVLGVPMPSIACFLSGKRPRCPWERTKPRYMICCLHIWAFFWETLYAQLAKQFGVLMVFCKHLSYVGLAISKSSTYRNKSLSSNMKFLRSLANISPNKVGEFLNP